MTQEAWIIRTAQRLFEDAGYYDAPISGRIGPATMKAVAIIERNLGVSAAGWPEFRRVVRAAQRVLDVRGFEPGPYDGIAGHNTREAMKFYNGQSRPVGEDRAPEPSRASGFPRESELTAYYGPVAGPDCTAGRVEFPFPFILDYDPTKSVRHFTCHKLIAPTFQAVFDEACREYGEKDYRRLKLDRFAGCFNPRKKRGGTTWSTHAWGIAFDLYQAGNQLRWGADRAVFARPEYEPFWKIVESKGLVSLGRTQNYDWMHVQGARK